MKVIIADIKNYFDKAPESRALLPKEAETVENWKKEGWVEHLFVQSNGCAMIVFKNVDEAKAKELTATLPLFPYFQKVDYTEMDKRY
jgi:hypothetical protein